MKLSSFFLAWGICFLLISAVPLAAENDFASGNPASAKRLVVEGMVVDDGTGQPIPDVTVQTLEGGRATRANADGRFRMVLPAGSYRLKFTHVGYYSQTITVDDTGPSAVENIRLKASMIDLGERTVFTRAYDPAQKIIALAIAHKKELLARIHDYAFDAYAKFSMHRTDKPDSESIFMIAESQLSAWWEQPDKFKQVITSRRQTANLPAENTLVAVGELLDFNRNRIDLGEVEVVSPTATDAMDYYNYYLLDTVYIDRQAVFVLEVEPKNEYQSLFTGEIHIADSTYDVVKVDLGFSKGARFPFVKNARLSQSLAAIDGKYWMPVEIRYGGDIDFDVPLPGIPDNLAFDYVASIYSYRIDEGLRPGTFDEYELEVDESADDVDSAAWAARQTIPLTALETYGYRRIDSLKHAPKPIYKRALMGLAAGMLLLTVGQHDLFHFNRVEGPYTGLGLSPDDWIPRTRLRLKTGYAFDDDNWQYRFGFNTLIWEKHKFRFGASIKDEIVHRPTVISDAGYNSTFNALFLKIDPFDYHREKGFNLSISLKPANHFRFTAGYADYRQSSKKKQTDYGVFRESVNPCSNPPIRDGNMRSVAANLRYDSRRLIKNKGREMPGFGEWYFRVEAGVEYAAPDFIDNDFDFRRYYARFRAQTRLWGLGSSALTGYAGSSDGDLPPQRYFIADFHDPDFFTEGGLNTVKEHNFGGDRLALVSLRHDFGSYMFRNSGLSLLQRLPFGLQIHGTALWTEFSRSPVMADPSLMTAPTVYGEAGFGLTNLTPFLMPFNLATYFTWQLTDYDTRTFNWLFGFEL